jgi:hypothetical protein
MAKSSGGGGNGGRTGGGGSSGAGTNGDAGQPGEVFRVANQMKDDELKSSVKILDLELDKTHASIVQQSDAKQFDKADKMRDLRETLQDRKNAILKEAGKRRSLSDQVQYKAGKAVGFK